MNEHLLVGVIHLPPLPGSPRSELSMVACVAQARECAKALSGSGYSAIVIENFGDAPFFAGKVPPITIAAMTACAIAVCDVANAIKIGINVLRNDAEAALSIAHAVGAQFIRVNVHTGARVTDQGIIQGDAAATLRLRRSLGGAANANAIAIWADVDVKHSAPLGPPRPIAQEVEDVTKRGLAEVVLVTGEGTGKGVDMQKLAAVKAAAAASGADVPVLVASGATIETLPALRLHSDGVIVGSAIRRDGIAGQPVDADLAKAFAAAWRREFK